MANYKDIHGGTVQNFAGDPPAPINGQVWYDSTNRDFHYLAEVTAGTWSTGGNLNSARLYIQGAGTQTAALGFAGAVPGQSPPKTNITESYNGSSWTEVGDMNTVRWGV